MNAMGMMGMMILESELDEHETWCGQSFEARPCPPEATRKLG